MQIILCVVFGYVIGQINPSYLIARLKGFDIRTRGSGNAGASNVVITMGAWAGIFCAMFDIAKAYWVVKLAGSFFPELQMAGMLAGTACILGHIFPAVMNGRGGKGLACLGGVVMASNMSLFLTLLAFEAVLLLLVNYICVVPVSGSITYFVILLVNGSVAAALIFMPAMLAIVYRHMENIRRIRKGREAHFSYLWNRGKEMDRLERNTGMSRETFLGE